MRISRSAYGSTFFVRAPVYLYSNYNQSFPLLSEAYAIGDLQGTTPVGLLIGLQTEVLYLWTVIQSGVQVHLSLELLSQQKLETSVARRYLPGLCGCHFSLQHTQIYQHFNLLGSHILLRSTYDMCTWILYFSFIVNCLQNHYLTIYNFM